MISKIDVTKLWQDIGKFETKEVSAWKNAEPNRQEARACARMQAYVVLFYHYLDSISLVK